MRFATGCSGIEAASVAWTPLGWNCVFTSEIDKAASAVLAHRHPLAPNFGDMTMFDWWPDAEFDVFAAGTPCQSFSIAGLQRGLDDPRGALMLTFGAIARRYRPRWLVWENVPNVLRVDGGRAFGTLLGMLALLGYGFAYRVLDAQFFGLAQRRKRVFVVAYLGDWRPAAAVLFEPESLLGHPSPRRSAGQDIAGNAEAGAAGDGSAIDAAAFSLGQITSPTNRSSVDPAAAAPTLAADGKALAVAFALRGRDGGSQPEISGDGASIGALRAASGGSSRDMVAFAIQAGAARENPNSGPDGVGVQTDVAYTIEARAEVQFVATSGVRRLTPRECERLQGFPDDYTLVPYRRRMMADGPRYKMLGNSMAVPVMRWIGKRIALVDHMARSERAGLKHERRVALSM